MTLQEEYEAKQKAATKDDKKNILTWNTKAVKNAQYRITFIRKPSGPNSTQSSDTAFYFENKDEVIMIIKIICSLKKQKITSNACKF